MLRLVRGKNVVYLAGYGKRVTLPKSFVDPLLELQIECKVNPKNYAKYENKLRLWRQQKGKCVYCNKQTFLFKSLKRLSHPSAATIEHIIPLSKKPKGRKDVIAMACRDCNNQRGNMKLLDYIRKYHEDRFDELFDRLNQFTGEDCTLFAGMY